MVEILHRFWSSPLFLYVWGIRFRLFSTCRNRCIRNGIPRKLPPDQIEPLFGGVGAPDRVRWHAIPFAHGVQRRPTLQLRLKPRAAPMRRSTPPRTLQSVSRDTPGNTAGSTTRTLRSVSRDTPARSPERVARHPRQHHRLQITRRLSPSLG